jgi:hypothetical protein
MADFDPSTPESRAGREAQRARDYPVTDERLDPLRESIAQRLRRSGVTLPPAEFEALVLDMARFALRWSQDEVQAREAAEREKVRLARRDEAEP